MNPFYNAEQALQNILKEPVPTADEMVELMRKARIEEEKKREQKKKSK